MRGRRSRGRTASRRSGASSGTGSSTERGRLPVVAVILAGGSGTRLWPLARARRPKQFLPLFGGRSLFGETYARARVLVGPTNVVVVAGDAHESWVRRQAPGLPGRNLLLEEIGRNTATSIALAALWIRARYGDGIMLVLPADQWIEPSAAFRSTVRRGIEAVRRTGRLLTIGVAARAADTGFGYIRPSGSVVGPGVREVAAFTEKPDLSTAARLVRSGRALWNCGIFIWRSETILRELGRHRPGIVVPLERWARRVPAAGWRPRAELLRRLPAVPIDRAVLERSRSLLVLRGSFRWSDLGTWTAVHERLHRDRRGNAAIGEMVAVDAARCLGINDGGLSVFVGVRDVVAVRSADAVLVCHLDAAQSVRRAVARLRAGLGRYR